MKVWKKQKGLLVRTMICAVSLAAACFYGNSLPAQAAPRAQETGERVVIVIDPGHGGDNEGTLEGPAQEKKMTMVTALAMYEELTKYDNVDVYLTHTDDVTMSLADRAQFAADRNADFRTALQRLRLSVRLGTDAADAGHGTVSTGSQDETER